MKHSSTTGIYAGITCTFESGLIGKDNNCSLPSALTAIQVTSLDCNILFKKKRFTIFVCL